MLAKIHMRHNKIGWETFLDVVEKVQQVSPWLSRQIQKRAAEWPFLYSGLEIRQWDDRHVHVHLPINLRNTIDGEISQGHLVLAGEFALRLLLLRYRHEFPFRHRLVGCRAETHHALDQAIDVRFEIAFADWERIRLELARGLETRSEFVVQALLADGRSAAHLTFDVAFQLEKFLPA